MTFWYRSEERSIRVALVLASATLAGAFGGKRHIPAHKSTKTDSPSRCHRLRRRPHERHRRPQRLALALHPRRPALSPLRNSSLLPTARLPRNHLLAHRAGQETRSGPSASRRLARRERAYDVGRCQSDTSRLEIVRALYRKSANKKRHQKTNRELTQTSK